jgi:hypothetical protein
LNDPHVEALIYVIEHDKSVSYEKAAPLEEEYALFCLKIKDDKARFDLKEHYSVEQEARAAVLPFIEQWEFEASLAIGPDQFTLRFERSQIVDRHHTPGVHPVSASATSWHFNVSSPTVTVSRQYPRPTSGDRLDISNKHVQRMFRLYESYRRGRGLPVIAYLCYEEFAKLGASVKNAADRRQISLKLVEELRKIVNKKGGDQARHADGIDHPLSQYETQLLEKTVTAMIVRAARVAADPCQIIPKIDRSNIFQISP